MTIFALRTTWSFDIRAPDLQELYQRSGYSVLGSVTDPHTGANVQTFTSDLGESGT